MNTRQTNQSRSYRRRWGFAVFPAIASGITVFLAWIVAVFLFGPSPRYPPLAILAWAYLTIIVYQIPPVDLSPRVYILLLGYSLAAATYCLLLLNTTTAIVNAVLFALGTGAFSLLEVVRLSYAHFHHLIEVIPVREIESSRSVMAAPLFSHVGDIHLTGSDDTARVEGGAGGHVAFGLWLALEERARPRYFVISGDVTDTGSETEWKRFTKIPHRDRQDHSRLMFAPGNHDLFSAYEGYPGSWGDRLWLYLRALAACAPETETAIGDSVSQLAQYTSGELEPRLQERAKKLYEEYIADSNNSGTLLFSDPHNPEWREKAQRELFWQWFEANRENLFPLRFVDHSAGVVVLVLNSCPDDPVGRELPPSALGTSALGQLGEPQLRRLEQMLTGLPDWCRHVLVLTHHAPFRRPGEWRWRRNVGAIKEYALLVHDSYEARRFLGLLVEHAHRHSSVNFYLCCGHRHTPTLAYAGRVLILEGASLAEADPSAWEVYVDTRGIEVSRRPIC